MLPHFLHLPLSTGYILAGLFSCSAGSAPDISLRFENNPPAISHIRSSAYLINLKKDSISPDYGDEFPILEGLTNGKVQLKYDIKFKGVEERHSRKACMAASAAHIVITYTPTVYISSDIPNGTCRYKVTLNHEMKHVQADITTINEYIPDIRASAVQALGHSQTAQPIDSRDVEEMRKDILAELSRAMKEQGNALEKSRAERQRRIDTRAEYDRLSHDCPGERRR